LAGDRRPPLGEFIRAPYIPTAVARRTASRRTCRAARVAEYAYSRSFFLNPSADIRGLFCFTCELLGVRWMQSNPSNISVAHRKSVVLLDALGCAKD